MAETTTNQEPLGSPTSKVRVVSHDTDIDAQETEDFVAGFGQKFGDFLDIDPPDNLVRQIVINPTNPSSVWGKIKQKV